MNSSAARKKNILLIALLIPVSLILSGCADDDYAIEKRYWRVKKQADKILANPHACPPNQLEKTVSALNSFSEKYPKSSLAVDAEFSIANLYIITKDYESGRAQLKKIIKKYEKSKELAAQSVFFIGNSYELEDKWPAALEQYKRILQNYPETVKGIEIPIYIAQHYKVKFEPDKMNAALQEAISHYKTMAARYPLTPMSYTMDMLVAQCYSEMKDWQSTINTLNAMLKTYNGKVSLEEIMLNLSAIYSQKLDNPAKAIEILNVLIKEYPKSRYVNPAKDIIKRLSEKQ
ncbi:MAG: tetratricopeptide repeat protein [Candidatus Omnitrophica bacterium]|nr:tetratricopeptide repeat protein [Candidatus Omnitrophota bacterium]MDD5661480.1 tetratricopeptide repeat protein [Candidatus Omnitrophota bacterium]